MSKEQDAAPSRKNPLKVLIPLLIIAGAGYYIWKNFIRQDGPPASVVAMTGRIEGDDSVIAPKVAGRIVEINFREGDSVKAGEVIAKLDDLSVRARVEQAEAQVANADTKRRAAEQQIAVLEEQIRQSELQTDQASVDAEGRVHQAENDLASAEATLAQQESAYKQAAWDRDTYVRLAKEGAVPERQGKVSQSNAETQEAVVAAARRRIDALKGSLNVARANLSNPRIRTSQTAALRRQIDWQRTQVATAGTDVARAKAQLDEVSEALKDLTVVAPFDGTVVTRTAEPGEVVQPGTAILTLLDLRRVYLRGFVPQGESGKVRVGQRARIFLDSDAKKPIDAELIRVDPQATFTPENTYFREDRVKQVVGVKLLLKGAVGFAKPGMPADGEVLVEGDTWPSVTYRK